MSNTKENPNQTIPTKAMFSPLQVITDPNVSEYIEEGTCLQFNVDSVPRYTCPEPSRFCERCPLRKDAFRQFGNVLEKIATETIGHPNMTVAPDENANKVARTNPEIVQENYLMTDPETGVRFAVAITQDEALDRKNWSIRTRRLGPEVKRIVSPKDAFAKMDQQLGKTHYEESDEYKARKRNGTLFEPSGIKV